jgi:hypothetical protein
MTPKSYEIIRSGSFDRDYSRLSGRISRLDEFIKGVEEVLSRKPEVGKPTKNKYILALKMRQQPNEPNLTIYYFYTKNNEVVLNNLRTDEDPKPPPIFL